MFANAKATKTRFFAVFAVMMLMLCSVAVIADADASPYGGIDKDSESNSKNQVYNIQISTGQTFTYSGITTNLSTTDYGTVTYKWECLSGSSAVDQTGTNGIAWDGSGKLSGTFTEAGTKTGTLTATWTAPEGSDNAVPTQTATQTLNFEVIEAIVIKDENKTHGWGMVDGTTSGKTVLTIPFDGTTTNTNAPEVKYVSGSDESKSPFAFAIVNKDADNQAIKVTVNKDLEETDVGAWKYTLTLSNTKTGQSDSTTIDLNVYNKIAVTNSTQTYYTFEGDTLKEFTFEIDCDDNVTESEDATMEFSDGGKITATVNEAEKTYTVMDQDSTNKHKVSINVKDFDVSGNLTGGGMSKDYTAKITITGQSTSDGNTFTATTTDTFTLKVYRSLEFTSDPTVKNTATISKSTGSNNLMTLSANVSGAKYVTINWGDGQISERSAVTETSTLLNAQHKYNNTGMYMITITAENDVGTTTSKVLYAVDSPLNADSTTDDTKKDSKGFFEQHGYLFLVFVLIVIGLLVAFFFFGIQHPAVLLAAIVCAILAVALYFYGDFSGIVDAIKGGK